MEIEIFEIMRYGNKFHRHERICENFNSSQIRRVWRESLRFAHISGSYVLQIIFKTDLNLLSLTLRLIFVGIEGEGGGVELSYCLRQ